MKSLEFDDLPGATPLDKYRYLTNQGTVYVQEKKNGIGVRIFNRGRDAIIGTRNEKVYPEGYFSPLPTWKFCNPDSQFMYLAELYSADPSVPLAKFAGGMSVNRKAADEEMLKLARFYIYDVRHVNGTPIALSKRQQLLAGIDPRYLPADLCDVAATTSLDAPGIIEMHWTLSMKNPLTEGFIYRVDPCYHHDGSPTYMQVKRTRLHTAEGTCVGITAGQGKRTGLLGSFQILLDNGRIFSLGGGTGLNDDMLAYYHDHPPLKRKITFSFKELSEFGLPLRAQFVAVRDYE